MVSFVNSASDAALRSVVDERDSGTGRKETQVPLEVPEGGLVCYNHELSFFVFRFPANALVYVYGPYCLYV